MKNRKINFIKLGMLLLGIFLFIISCESETIEVEPINSENSNLKTVPLNQAKVFLQHLIRN